MKNENPLDPNLDVFNGIRVYAISWVILGHTFAFKANIPTTNLTYFFWDNEHNYWLSLISGGVVSVDVFFFI